MGPVVEPVESALVVLVPEADAVVGPHRRALDPAAGWGVSAHVTVLYPFVPPARIDDEVRRRVAGAVGQVQRFACTFARTAWFDETAGSSGTPAELRAAQADVSPALPIRTSVEEVALLAGAPAAGSWRPVDTFPLA